MALIKKSTNGTLPTETRDFRASAQKANTTVTQEANEPNIKGKPESGADAAIERLSKKPADKPQYKARDFDAEARGKTRCVQYEAALMSPAIAGMAFNTMDEYLKLVQQAAEVGVKYTFGE